MGASIVSYPKPYVIFKRGNRLPAEVHKPRNRFAPVISFSTFNYHHPRTTRRRRQPAAVNSIFSKHPIWQRQRQRRDILDRSRLQHNIYLHSLTGVFWKRSG